MNYYNMNITNLLAKAEDVRTGEILIGFVCCCKSCRTPFPDEILDRSRPVGLLTDIDEKFGNVRVYTDTMEFVKKET